MTPAEKQSLILRGMGLQKSTDISETTKHLIGQLCLGWQTDLAVSVKKEIAPTEYKVNHEKIMAGMDDLTEEELKSRIASISIEVGKIMKSAMLLHNAMDEADKGALLNTQIVKNHVNLLEAIFEGKAVDVNEAGIATSPPTEGIKPEIEVNEGKGETNE